MNEEMRQPAPLLRRAAAFAIDLFLINLIGVVLVMAAFGGMAVALRQMGQALPSQHLIVSLAEYGASGWPLLVIVYFGALTNRGGQTPGKMAFRIMVVATRHTEMGRVQAWWRAAAVCASLPVFAVFALAAFTPQKRALHDYLAGTRVIARPDPLPSPPPAQAAPVTDTQPVSVTPTAP